MSQEMKGARSGLRHDRLGSFRLVGEQFCMIATFEVSSVHPVCQLMSIALTTMHIYYNRPIDIRVNQFPCRHQPWHDHRCSDDYNPPNFPS